MANLFDPIYFHARQRPHQPALAFPGGFITYGQLASAATSAAQAIQAAGFRKNELVAIGALNPVFQIVTMVALGQLGIPSLNPSSDKPEHYKTVGVRGYIGERAGNIYGDVRVLAADQNWYVSRLNGQVRIPHRGVPFAPYENCRVAMSSGTTGVPKAIELTAATMKQRLSRVTISNTGLRTLVMLGLNTAWGFLLVLRTLRTGGTYCFAPFPADILDLCLYAHVQDMWLTPAQLSSLLEEQAKLERPINSLETITIGGSSIAPRFVSETTRRLCKRVILTYGATETGPVASSFATLIQDTPGAVGYPFPWVDIEIVDEADQKMGLDKEGIVRIKSPDMVTSYISQEEGTEGSFRDGWFYPGDIGMMRSDGLFAVTGRNSEVLNRGGVKIAPTEIEDVIRGHGAVDDVAVVSGASKTGGLEIWAAIVSARGFSAVELRSWCGVKLGAAAPDKFIQVQHIPKNAAGKVITSQLKAHLQKQLG